MKRHGAVLVALTIVLVVGTLALWTPLATDQAIFTCGGRAIALYLAFAGPAYVYVTPYDRTVLEEGAPELVEFLDREYVPVRKINRGTLMVLP